MGRFISEYLPELYRYLTKYLPELVTFLTKYLPELIIFCIFARIKYKWDICLKEK